MESLPPPPLVEDSAPHRKRRWIWIVIPVAAALIAGAIIYFSHRGGIDILGKIDPYIARLPALLEGPAEKRCWRPERPGHNKEDIATQFELRQPELSEQKPPEALWAAYRGFRYGGLYFYARRDAPHVHWDKILKAEPVTAAVPPLF